MLAWGLLLGFLIGALLLARYVRGRNPLAGLAAALLLIAAAAGAVIILSWQAGEGPKRLLDWAELALTLASGPVALLLVGLLLRTPLRPWPPILIALAAFAGLISLERALGGDPIRYAVPIQAGFTVWGWLLFARHPGNERLADGKRIRRQHRLALWVLIALSVAHAASFLRTGLPEVEILRPIVPLTLSLGFLFLLLAMLWLYVDRLDSAFPPVPGEDSEAAKLASRAAELIVKDQLFRQPDLTAAQVAARLDLAPGAFSRLLAESGSGGFAAMLRTIRLDQARKMLADPKEAATSIDAVGMLCGFRSRSAFYESFQDRYSMSPGAWREQSLSGSGIRTRPGMR